MNFGRWMLALAKFAWLLGELLAGCIAFYGLRFRGGNQFSSADRAHWLQSVARRVVRVLGATIHVIGPIPSRGLLISNHTSYVDIVMLAATMPCSFVSKREVRNWPLFGWFASTGGTLFLDRGRRQDVARMADDLAAGLGEGRLIVIFPEGTSTDGTRVLPFRTSLLEVAVGSAHPLSAVGIRYHLPRGSVANEVCWWGDMTLTEHLPRLLSRRGLEVHLAFAPFDGPREDRKRLAHDLHHEVVRLRAQRHEWKGLNH